MARWCTLRDVAGEERRAERPARVALDRRAVVDGALSFLAERDLEDLTMRALAAHLGAGTMSPYRHFRCKDDLLDAVCAELLGRVEVPPPTAGDGDWAARLHGLLCAWRDTLAAHPAVAVHLMGRPVVSVGTLRPVDAVLGLLRAGGLDDDAAARAFLALLAHTVGCAFLALQRRSLGAVANPELVVRRLQAEALSGDLRHAAAVAPALVAASAEDPLPGGIDRILRDFVGGREA